MAFLFVQHYKRRWTNLLLKLKETENEEVSRHDTSCIDASETKGRQGSAQMKASPIERKDSIKPDEGNNDSEAGPQ